jgi:hypothetical protein
VRFHLPTKKRVAEIAAGATILQYDSLNWPEAYLTKAFLCNNNNFRGAASQTLEEHGNDP